MDYTYHFRSPIGGITMASDGEALTGLWFDGQKYFADTLSEQHEVKELEVFKQAERWLAMYFNGNIPDFTPKLHMRMTAFQKEVWDILLTLREYLPRGMGFRVNPHRRLAELSGVMRFL